MKKFPISDHCNGYSFFNPSGEKPKSFRDIWRWKSNHQRKRWPVWVENSIRPKPVITTTSSEIVLTFINHVTFLIQTAGLNILTDPVFSKRVSPSQRFGPKRIRDPGLLFEDLPKIDLVLVSHNHYDHLDLASITQLTRVFNPQFMTPLGNGKLLRKAGAANIIETDWWQSSNFYASRIITVPAKHWSARGLHDRNRALWGGFIIHIEKKKIYFTGDTGYGSHFKDIRKQVGVVDLALLPIGAYEPRWFMRDSHMNPEDAVMAHLDLGAKLSIGMHFGTFQLTDEGFDEPIEELKLALEKYQVTNFFVLEVGETRQLN